MSELPEGWALTTIASVAEPPEYGLTAKAEYHIEGPKFLRITDIQNGAVDWANVPRCKCCNMERFLLQSDDLLFARTGATTGKSYLIGELSEPTVFASYLIRLRPKSICYPRFLALFFQTDDYWRQIEDVASGSAQPGVNASKLERLEFPFAPFAEQRRIVARIDALFGRTKAARDQLAKVAALDGGGTREIRLLDNLEKAILAKAFRGELVSQDPNDEPAERILESIYDTRNCKPRRRRGRISTKIT